MSNMTNTIETPMMDCPTCKGMGNIIELSSCDSEMEHERECSDCNGSGRVQRCIECGENPAEGNEFCCDACEQAFSHREGEYEAADAEYGDYDPAEAA